MKRISAAIIFFTRLPLWKVVNPPQDAYKDVVVFWPMVGWLTGGFTAVAMWAMSFIVAWPIAVVVALTLRLLLTGALHEDGLADFCDGFGCGGDKDRILSIMKDSQIGTYGVIGLIMYYLLTFAILTSLPVEVAALGFFAADSYSKACAAQITNRLPYARPEGAKNKISYSRMSLGKLLICIISGILPLGISVSLLGLQMFPAVILPSFVMMWMVNVMRRKIGGYTGDCCGATFLVCELMFLINLSILYSPWGA